MLSLLLVSDMSAQLFWEAWAEKAKEADLPFMRGLRYALRYNQTYFGYFYKHFGWRQRITPCLPCMP